jgi:DNA-binding GntR family transcriptional regulator
MANSKIRNSKGKPLTDKIYETLLEHILSGKRKAGEPLSELALTRELGVSRTPVHNAMLQLMKDGLIKQDPCCSPVVQGLTPQDIHEIFEMRILLEGETSRLAATRIRKADLNKLFQKHETVKVPIDDRNQWLEGWADYDELFHYTIAKAGKNRRLAKDVTRYRLLHRGLNLFGFEEEQAPLDKLRTAIEEHARILEAIEKQDAEAARDAMKVHLRSWQEFFANLFKSESSNLNETPNLLVTQ